MMFRAGRQGRPTLFIPGSSQDKQSESSSTFMGVHPHHWSREDVKAWLDWCIEEFALEGIDQERFSMNGKALCMLTKPDFNDRAKNGDVLFNTLRQFLNNTNNNNNNHGGVVFQHGVVYSGLQSNHVVPNGYNDEMILDVKPLASPHDIRLQSPLAAASPPLMPRHHILQRQSSVPISVFRSISKSISTPETPLDLSKDMKSPVCQLDSSSNDEPLRNGFNQLERQSSNFSPSSDELSPHRYQNYPRYTENLSVSPGSRSPARRPSPSSMEMSPVPNKLQRLSSYENGSPHLLPTPPIHYREHSPEHLRGLRQKLAQARLDNAFDGHGSEMSKAQIPTSVIDQVSDTSDISPPSDSDSQTEDAMNGHIRPINIVPSRYRNQNKGDANQIPLTVGNVDTFEDSFDPDNPDCSSSGDTKLLWEFIYQCLCSPAEYSSLVRWEDESQLVFRILNPAELAKLWGLQKNRGNMTYEKLSRSLRYYYKMNIIIKEPHRRLSYRFVRNPESIQRGQRGARTLTKRRLSCSPSTSPSCSPTSTSPVSPSSTNSSPTMTRQTGQLPLISVSTPPTTTSTPHLTLDISRSNEHAIKQEPEPLSAPIGLPGNKPYSPITARAYFNLLRRQYSMDSSRRVPPIGEQTARTPPADWLNQAHVFRPSANRMEEENSLQRQPVIMEHCSDNILQQQNGSGNSGFNNKDQKFGDERSINENSPSPPPQMREAMIQNDVELIAIDQNKQPGDNASPNPLNSAINSEISKLTGNHMNIAVGTNKQRAVLTQMGSSDDIIHEEQFTRIPFQNPLPKLAIDSNTDKSGLSNKVQSPTKEDMIKQESLEFTVGEISEAGKMGKISELPKDTPDNS